MMLAGVSHDLRTPLTRLKLQLAMQDDTEETRAAKADLKDMESMLNGYLDFARGLGREKLETVNLSKYLLDVSQGQSVILDQNNIPPDVEISIRPKTLQRAIHNLISNGVKYANGSTISANKLSDRLQIFVDDAGPGISEENREDAFRMFNRLDSARSQNIEGVGLGLAIARDIAQLHGGSLVLEDSPLGGLRAIITLPH